MSYKHPEIPDRHRFGDGFLHGNLLRVRLNGEIMHMVLGYSISGAWVERIKTDEAGKVVLNEDRTDVVTERLTGIVLVDYDPDKVR